MRQEEYETRFYEKQAGRARVVNTPNDSTKTPDGEEPVVDSRDAMEQKKDKIRDKIESTYNPREAMDRKKDEIWGQVNGNPLTYPAKPAATPLPQPGASPIIPVTALAPFPANAEYAYVFYTDTSGADFSKQAEYQKKLLEKQGYQVKMVCVTDAATFSNAWNNMNRKTATAVIISHCNGMSLIFEEGSPTNAMSSTGFGRNNNVLPSIGSLKGPDVDNVYLYACNAGHEELLEEKGTNVADAFRDLPGVDTVYAYVGALVSVFLY